MAKKRPGHREEQGRSKTKTTGSGESTKTRRPGPESPRTARNRIVAGAKKGGLND